MHAIHETVSSEQWSIMQIIMLQYYQLLSGIYAIDVINERHCFHQSLM